MNSKFITIISITIYIFLSVSSNAQTVDTKKPSSSKQATTETSSKEKNKIRVDDFFYLNGKSIPIYLTNSEDIWKFDLPKQPEAEAKVPIEHDATLTIKSKYGGNFDFSIKGDKPIKITVRKLPNGKFSAVLLSKNLYAERFRLVYAHQAIINSNTPINSFLFFIEGPTDPPL